MSVCTALERSRPHREPLTVEALPGISHPKQTRACISSTYTTSKPKEEQLG